MKKQSLTVSQAAKRAKKIRYRHPDYGWISREPETVAAMMCSWVAGNLDAVMRGDLCGRDGLGYCYIDEDRETWCEFCRRIEILPDDFEPKMEAGAEMRPTVVVEFEHRNPHRPVAPEQVAEMFVRDMPAQCADYTVWLRGAWCLADRMAYHQLRPGQRRFMDL